MRAAPGEAEGKLWQAGENAEKCGAGGGKSKKTEKVEKKSKKNRQKVWKSGKERYLCSPVPEGGPLGRPFVGGSSLNRKKEARAGPAVPAPSGRGQKLRPVQGKKTKVVLYNEEFDPGSG